MGKGLAAAKATEGVLKGLVAVGTVAKKFVAVGTIAGALLALASLLKKK
jgi:hypothetical protein